jgi:hypothetical protein
MAHVQILLQCFSSISFSYHQSSLPVSSLLNAANKQGTIDKERCQEDLMAVAPLVWSSNNKGIYLILEGWAAYS